MRRAALLLSRVFSLKVATFCSNPFEHVSFVRFQEESLYMVLLENKNHECLLAFYWKCLMMKKMNSNFSFYTFHSTDLKNNFYTTIVFLQINQTFTFTFIYLNTIIFFLIFNIHCIYDLDKYNKCRYVVNIHLNFWLKIIGLGILFLLPDSTENDSY